MYLCYGFLFLFVVVVVGDRIDTAKSAETRLLADLMQEEGIRLDYGPRLVVLRKYAYRDMLAQLRHSPHFKIHKFTAWV